MSDEQGWNGPGRSQPDPVQQLLAIVKAQDKRIAALERGSPLRAAGIGMTPDGMSVDSSLDVLGSLSSTGTASFGGDTDISGDLDVTGNATFSGDTTIGGNAAITGTLSLPAGIIDNDALANPIEVRSGFATQTNFPYTESEVDRSPVTINVPSGFTLAIFTAVTTAYGFNSTTTDSGIAARTYASTPQGVEQWTGISLQGLPANWSGTTQSTLISTMPVVGGSTLTALSQVQAAWSAIPADPNHFVDTAIQVVFAR